MARSVNYNPTPTVSRFHRSEAFYRVVVGPVASGKSTGMVMELLRRMREQARGPDGLRRSRFLITRNSANMLADTTLKTWLDWVGGVGTVRKVPLEHEIAIGDIRSLFIFRPLDTPDDINRVLSMELTGAWFNELRAFPLEVVEAVGDRCGRYPPQRDGGCTWRGVIGDTNPPDTEHWIHDYAEVSRPDGWEFFHQPPALFEEGGGFVENPDAENLENLEPGYYVTRAQGKSKEHCRIYYCGNYGFATEGKSVIPEYSDPTHCKPLKRVAGAPLYVGFDWGLCYSAATEVFTEHGWRFMRDVVGDREIKVLSLPPYGGEPEFIKPNFGVNFDYEGPMIHYSDDVLDFMVTPEHSVFCKRLGAAFPEFMRAEDLAADRGDPLFIKCGPDAGSAEWRRISPSGFSVTDYVGNVYCLNMEHGTLFVRRDDGSPHWNGNTPAAVIGQRVDTKRWEILHEIVTDNTSITEFAGEFTQFMRMNYPGERFMAYGDPAGDVRAQTDKSTPFSVMKAAGIEVIPAPSNDLNMRREAVAGPLSNLVNGVPRLLISESCVILRQGLMGGYCYKKQWSLGKEKFSLTPLKNKFSHVCFVGETPISVPGGTRRIDELRPGDLVVTPSGPVAIKHTMSRTVKRLMELDFGHVKLVCTPDHPFITARGKVRADELQYDDVFYGQEEEVCGSRSLMGSLFTRGKEAISLAMAASRGFMVSLTRPTGMFGYRPTGRSLTGILFTIGTVIDRITQSRILNYCQQRNTTGCTPKSDGPILNTARNMRRNGPILNFAQKMLSSYQGLSSLPMPGRGATPGKNNQDATERKFGSAWEALKRLALCAGPNLPLPVCTPTELPTVPPTASVRQGTGGGWTTNPASASYATESLSPTNTSRHAHAVALVGTSYVSVPNGVRVFDLELEFDHTFYAGHVKVSNCEALEYVLYGAGEGPNVVPMEHAALIPANDDLARERPADDPKAPLFWGVYSVPDGPLCLMRRRGKNVCVPCETIEEKTPEAMVNRIVDLYYRSDEKPRSIIVNSVGHGMFIGRELLKLGAPASVIDTVTIKGGSNAKFLRDDLFLRLKTWLQAGGYIEEQRVLDGLRRFDHEWRDGQLIVASHNKYVARWKVHAGDVEALLMCFYFPDTSFDLGSILKKRPSAWVR